MRIQSLRPRLSLEAASARLLASGWRRLFFARRRGTLAEFYVPYFVFTVDADVNGRRERSFWAIDGRDGSLDAIPLKRLPDSHELVEHETTNCLDFQIDEARARSILHDRLRYFYHSHVGPFALREFNLTVVVPALRLHWPYWVAAFQRRSRHEIEALDAIHGAAQGKKWKDLVLGRVRLHSSSGGERVR